MTTYITSDLHFGHKNMTQEGTAFLSTRAHFKTVEEMNQSLIDAHNSVVTNNDVTYHLGDLSISYTKPEVVFEHLTKMKGRFVLVRGNHDNSRLMSYIEKNNYNMANGHPKFIIHDVGFREKHNKKIFFFSHYPLMTGSRGGSFSIHGHIHEYASPLDYGINVGIDSPEIESDVFGAPLRLDYVLNLAVEKFERQGTVTKYQEEI